MVFLEQMAAGRPTSCSALQIERCLDFDFIIEADLYVICLHKDAGSILLNPPQLSAQLLYLKCPHMSKKKSYVKAGIHIGFS